MTTLVGHYQSVAGANVIATKQLLRAADLVGDIVEVRAMGAIYGPAGTGKTFAVEQALAGQPERSWTRTAFRSRPTTRYLRHELYSDLGLGEEVPNSPVETDRMAQPRVPGIPQISSRRPAHAVRSSACRRRRLFRGAA